MKFLFLLAGLFLLFSCTSSNVDLSLNSSFDSAVFQVMGGTTVSKNASPTVQLISYFPDIFVTKLAFFDNDRCADGAVNLGQINNTLAATLTFPTLADGDYTFFYKPIYEQTKLNQSAKCYSSGLSYTVDTMAPNPLIISIDSNAQLSPSQTVTVKIAGCENTKTGASGLILKESLVPPVLSDPWGPCSPTAPITVSAAEGPKTIYAFTKDLAGNISSPSSLASYHLSSAKINFGSGSGPGSSAGATGYPYVTVLNATISGDGIEYYKYKFGLSNLIDCADTTSIPYTGETLASAPIGLDLHSPTSFYPDGSVVKICVIGKDTSGHLQQVSEATSFTWTLNPSIEVLSAKTPTYIISIDNVPLYSNVPTRPFIQNPGSSAGCAGCNPTTVTGSILNFNVRSNASPSMLTNNSIIINSEVTPSYQIQTRTQSPICGGGSKRMFLSRSKINGAIGGRSQADAFCTTQAAALGGSWSALISSGISYSYASGISRLNAAMTYCDSTSNTKIYEGGGFVASFYHFNDGTPTNGGSLTDWQYVPNAPRSINSNPILYGGTTDCNCNDWTTADSNANCGGGGVNGQVISGLLTHASNASNAFSQTKITGGSGQSNYESCATPQHIICFEN